MCALVCTCVSTQHTTCSHNALTHTWKRDTNAEYADFCHRNVCIYLESLWMAEVWAVSDQIVVLQRLIVLEKTTL